MEAFWLILGIIVLAVGLLDLFLTALGYDEAGFLATRLCQLMWHGLRTITRRMSRRGRPRVLRQVMGLQVMLSIATWLVCVIVGFAFIYYSQMQGPNFQYAGQDLGAGMFSAIYFSAAQLATVGTSQISPQTNVLRILTILETLSGVVLITLSLSFLLGVYQVIRDLRTLCANFLTAEADTGDVMASLAPYFPQGEPAGLDDRLRAISDSFWSYSEGLRLHRIAYYFQSGRDQFSLPYTLHMMGQTVAALRWGLPAGHPATQDPSLLQLTTQFDQFANDLHDRLGWTSAAVPEVMALADFSAAYDDASPASDYWLGRFLRLNRAMAQLAKLDSGEDIAQTYERYCQWLPFAYRAEQVAAAVSRDLDYQPIVRGDEAARAEARQAGYAARRARAPFSLATLVQPLRNFVNRWVIVSDPGLTRLTMAASATLAAAASVVTLYFLFQALGIQALPAAMFGGMVGMYATSMPTDAATADRKVTTALMVVPVIITAALGAAVSPWFALSAAVLVVVVLLGVGIGRFGPRFAALGQMAFMAYYFTLLLHIPLSMLPAAVAAAAIGAVWAYLFRFVFLADRPVRVLSSGLDGFGGRLVEMFDPLIDAISAARWDPDLRRRADANMRQLHQRAAILQGQLRVIDPTGINLHAGPGELRLAVFDTELAADTVMAATRDIARDGAKVPVVLRAQLAGMLERAQRQLRQRDAPTASEPTPDDVLPPPEQWPQNARHLRHAVGELVAAAHAMRHAQSAALTDPDRELGGATLDLPPKPALLPTRPQAGSPESSTRRRAIQAALATGLALLLGMTVTTEHQYWAALAAFLVLGGTTTVEETVVKGAERVAGTVLGAIMGFAITIITGANPMVVLPLLAVCVFASLYMRPVSYSQTVFWTTMMLALLYETLGTLTRETLVVRVMETIIGAVVALGVARLVLPLRTRKMLNDNGVMLIRTIDDIAQTCLQRLNGNTGTASLTVQALTLDQRLRQLNLRAEPLRRSSGSLGLDGIERRLTAAAALTYYARHLIRTTEALAPDAPPLPGDVGQQLATITRDNIEALIQLLNGEPPGPIHEREDFPLEPEDTPSPLGREGSEREAVHTLELINHTVLTLIEDLTSSGATSPTA
jgi:uncharacterized membrane protein YccC